MTLPAAIRATKTVYYDTESVRASLLEFDPDATDADVLGLIHEWSFEDFDGDCYGLFDDETGEEL